MQRLEPGKLSTAMDREIDGLQKLPLEEQVRLLELARAGDIDARNKFFESCLPLIRFLLRKYYRFLDENEVIQDCAETMLARYMAFDPSRGALSSYTRLLMRQVFRERHRERPEDVFHADEGKMEFFAGAVKPNVLSGELREKLADAVEEMGSRAIPFESLLARARAAAVLRMAYGLDGGDPVPQTVIAKMEGRSKQAVQADMSFGLAQLRRMPIAKELALYLEED